MTHRIVLPVDGSPYARWAGEFVCRHLAAGDAPIEVSLVHVAASVPAVDALGADPKDVERFYADEAARMFAPFRKMLDARSIRYRARGRVGNAGIEIAQQVADDGAELVVMGARGVGALHELAFGSTLHRVLAETPVPVLALRKPPARRRPRRALLAVDGSAPSGRALEALVGLRGLFGSALRVDLAHVARPVSLRESVALGLGPRDQYYARLSEQALRPARAALERAGIGAESVAAVGDAGERLAEIARERDVDLVVVGSHGRGGAKRLVMGSVSRSVLARVDAPVLIVR